MDKRLVKIMRGLPGSGKSFWAGKLFPDALVLSTDFHHMVEGAYVFDPTRLAEYHDKTLWQYTKAVVDLTPLIVVDNTNIPIV